MSALPSNSSVRTPEGNTTFNSDENSNTESIALSYEALKEVTAQITEAMKDNISQYSGLVIFNEPDFVALAKYRFYRNQMKYALGNYDLVAKNLEKLNRENSLPETASAGRYKIKSIDPLTMALSLPSIGTSYAQSVAGLFSVFRSDTIITQSKNTLDNASLSTAMANELKKTNPKLEIYYPQAFVPEYDLETDGKDSLFAQLSRISEANANLGEFVTQSVNFPEPERNASPLREVISQAETVKKQLQALTLNEASAADDSEAGAEYSAARPNMSEFRQLIRAEKLDHFLRGDDDSVSSRSNEPRIGILKLRVLASGGSRRETRNLFLGNKISYSGSAIIEVLLFDADGTLRVPEIFSFHTGFRKMKTNDKKP